MTDFLKKATDFANKNGITLVVLDPKYDKNGNNAQGEYIFPCTLRCGNEKYVFNYTQGLQDGKRKPDIADIFLKLQKTDAGTFENFCRKRKYKISIPEEKKLAKKLYSRACREYLVVQNLFPEDILKELQKLVQ